jgi:hypothetical protein
VRPESHAGRLADPRSGAFTGDMHRPHDDGGGNPFAPGTRVVAAVRIGGLLRPRVPAGSPGVVVAVAPGELLEVLFEGDRTELVRPDQLSPFHGFFGDDGG